MTFLLNIFYKTRQTFETVEERISSKQLNLILLITAFSLAVQSVMRDFSSLKQQSFGTVFLMLVFTTAFLFLAFKYAYPWLFWKISKLFAGKASLKQMRIVVAFALLPALIFLLIYTVLTGIAIFYRSPEILSYNSSITLLVVSLITFRIAIIGLSYYNKYSYGYALLTLLIPTTIIQLIFLVLR